MIDRREGTYWRYTRTARGSTAAPEAATDPAEAAVLDAQWWGDALEGCALLDEVGADVDLKSFLAGESTPVFVGSALTTFGVRLLPDAVIDLAPAPSPRPDEAGSPRSLAAPFSGLVFKVQANMDPLDTGRTKQFRRGPWPNSTRKASCNSWWTPAIGEAAPLLGAAGQMQFEVFAHRLAHEFGAPVEVRPAAYAVARRTDEVRRRAAPQHPRVRPYARREAPSTPSSRALLTPAGRGRPPRPHPRPDPRARTWTSSPAPAARPTSTSPATATAT